MTFTLDRVLMRNCLRQSCSIFCEGGSLAIVQVLELGREENI